MQKMFSVVLLFVFLLSIVDCRKPFAIGERIMLYASSVGPTSYNPHETYPYHSFPFCLPKKMHHKFPSIGEALQGIELVETSLDIQYQEAVKKSLMCTKEFTWKDIRLLRTSIKREFWSQFFFDELPVWGLIGRYDEDTKKYYVYRHLSFTFGYNRQNHVVEVNLDPQDPVLLNQEMGKKEKQKFQFSYAVDWKFVDLPYSRRFERYLDKKFFQHKIHWFSIINSFLMVLFLSGLLVMVIIRTVRNEIGDSDQFGFYNTGVSSSAGQGKSSSLDPFEDSFKETSWKKLSMDVFRKPNYLGLFSAIIGSGVQLTLLVFVLIVTAIVFTFYDDPGGTMTTFVIFYVLSSIVSGFVSGSFYLQHGGTNWIRTMLLTSSLFPGITYATYGVMNAIALLYQSTQAIPFLTILLIFGSHVFLTVPLVFIGTILGRSFNGDGKFPCKGNLLKRPIPRKPIYLKSFVLIFGGGILPFGSIFIELYFIFSSFQTYKIYYVYGFFLAVYIILLVVVICISIVLTYFLLLSEDYRWRWTSFFLNFTTGLYTFIYSLFFYQNTKMRGLFQFVYYASHTFLFSGLVGVICGTVGFYASYLFVRRIYSGIKIE